MQVGLFLLNHYQNLAITNRKPREKVYN